MSRDLDAMITEREQVTLEIVSLQAQLSNRNIVDTKGRRASPRLVHEWRAKTVREIAELQQRSMALKAMIREERQERLMARVAAKRGAISMLTDAQALFSKLAEEGVDFDKEETALFSEIRVFLARSKTATTAGEEQS